MIQFSQTIWNHSKNIHVGDARVIYEPGNSWTEEGWALPGGGKTQDRDEAVRVAKAMNELMQ